jgi:cytochrome c553
MTSREEKVKAIRSYAIANSGNHKMAKIMESASEETLYKVAAFITNAKKERY